MGCECESTSRAGPKLQVGGGVSFAARPALATVSVDLQGEALDRSIEVRIVPPPPRGAWSEAASRAVIQAALRHDVLEKDARRLVLVPSDANLFQLLGGSYEFGHRLAGLREDTQRDYEARNVAGVLPPGELDLGVPCVILPSDGLDAMFRAHGRTFWRHFYDRYPGKTGVVRISAVGFSDDSNQALVSVAHARGDLAGTGVQYLLEKQGERWVVTAKNLLWVS